MLGVALRPSCSTRCSLLIAAAIALVLPPPARCFGCTLATGNCPQCTVGHAAQPDRPARACCRDREHKTIPTASAPAACQQVDRGRCACKLQPVERIGISTEPRLTGPEPLVALAGGAPALDMRSLAVASAVFSHADLPPPVPHRVLHCSWII